MLCYTTGSGLDDATHKNEDLEMKLATEKSERTTLQTKHLALQSEYSTLQLEHSALQHTRNVLVKITKEDSNKTLTIHRVTGHDDAIIKPMELLANDGIIP